MANEDVHPSRKTYQGTAEDLAGILKANAKTPSFIDYNEDKGKTDPKKLRTSYFEKGSTRKLNIKCTHLELMGT